MSLRVLGLLWLVGCTPSTAPTAGETVGAVPSDPQPSDFDGDGYFADDCDDGDAAVHPGAVEVCDAIDNDCDRTTDEDALDAIAWYADLDADRFGDPGAVVVGCERPFEYVDNGLDCDGQDPRIHPGALETCNHLDDDCNGLVDDDALEAEMWYADADADGWGDPARGVEVCDAPAGHVQIIDGVGDCDDTTNLAFPGNDETCSDGLDNDCSGDAGGCELSGALAVTTALRSIQGTAAGDYVGSALAGGGDLNGDGYADIVIGACGYDVASSSPDVGRAYVFWGPVEPSDTLATADATLTGEGSSDFFGYSAAMLGDLDGDGRDEVGIGAPRRNTTATDGGEVYVFASPSGSLAGSDAGMTIGSDSTSDWAGMALSDAGDFDGDGLADMLVAAPYHDGATASNAGLVALFEYADGERSLEDDAEVSFHGEAVSDAFGTALAGVGDVDGDGADDVLIGAYGSDATGSGAGGAWLFLGGARSGEFSADAADLELHGAAAGDRFGVSVAGVGDTNGDGLEEFAVGADGAGATDAGAVYLWRGLTAGPALMFTGAAASDAAGHVVRGAGDVDGDALDDVIVSATGFDERSTAGVGAVYLVYAPSAPISLADADAIRYGANANDAVGASLAGAGDTDGDGYDDFLVGSTTVDPSGQSDAGGVWLFLMDP